MQVATMESDTDMVVKRLSVPMGLEELMDSLTKEVLRRKPSDIYAFASEHFAQLLEIRDQGNYRGSLRRIGKSYSLVSHDVDCRSNHVKIKSATFGTVTKPKRTHTRNKSPAPKSFLTKKNVVSKVDSNIALKTSSDNKNSKVLSEKYQASKKNLKDSKMKIEVNKQPLELESKKITETQRKSDNTRKSYEKRRSIVVQKRSNEKDVTGKLRSRSSSINVDGDISQNSFEKIKRKSDQASKKMEERKKTKYATMRDNETADELKVSKIALVSEKVNSKMTEKFMKEDAYNQSIPQASATLANIDISESVMTQMQKQHNEEGSFDTSDKGNSKNRKSFTSNCTEDLSKDEIDNQGNDVLITVVSQKKLSEEDVSTTENSKDNENYQESYSEISNADTEDTEKISEGKIELIISNIDDDYKSGEVKEEKGTPDGKHTNITNPVENTLQTTTNVDDVIYVMHDNNTQDNLISKNEIEQKQQLQDMTSENIEGKLKDDMDEVSVVKEDQETNKSDLITIDNFSHEENENIKLNQQTLNQFEAAIVIQAVVRGYLTRKVFNNDKVSSKKNITRKDVCNYALESVNEIVDKNLESNDNQVFPVALFNNNHERTDLKQNLINEVSAALKIQAFVRKYLRRKAINKELVNDLKNKGAIDDSLPLVLKSVDKTIKSEIIDDNLIDYESENVNKIISNTLHESIDLDQNLQNETKAVVKIQALVRGHLTRKMINEKKLLPIKGRTGNEIILNIPSKENGNIGLKQGKTSTIEAATKIQALIRGHLTRKGIKQAKLDKNMKDSFSLQNNMNLVEHKKMENDTTNQEFKTDFDDMNSNLDVIRAATIIQAYVRSFLLRTNLRKNVKSIPLHDGVSLDVSKTIIQDRENHKQITFDFLEQEYINYDSDRYDNSRFDLENKSTNELVKIIDGSIYEDDGTKAKICQKQELENNIGSVGKSTVYIERPFGDDVKPKINIIEKLAEISELQKPSECDELPHQRSSIQDAKKAATIIQALFRGYLTRKRYDSLEQRLNNKKSFEEKLPTVLEVEDEESKESTLSSSQIGEGQREKLEVKVLEDISAEHFSPSLDKPIETSVKRDKTISDDEVLAMIKQLDDSPIPVEEPRRRSKTYTRSLTIDEPSIQHTNINLLMKSPTFIIGDEFQTFDTNESVDQSARTAEESLTSIESSDSNRMFEQGSDIKEITTAIKEDVQKLKETLENGIETNKVVDINNIVDDGNIREITKAISEDVKELEKTLSEDSLPVTTNNLNNYADSGKIDDFVDKNESYTRPVSKDSATSTDSVDTVIFNEMYKGETCESELNMNTEINSDINFEKKNDEISKQSDESLQFHTVKQRSDILVNDILDTAAKKIQKFFKEVKNKNKSDSDNNQTENLKQTSSNLLNEKKQSTSSNELRQLCQDEAAIIIQRNYKGYRVRHDLEKQKQEIIEDKEAIEQRADEEITEYLRQITEPIRRAFSAEKGINEKGRVDVELKNRVRSADGGPPNIIYIPLRDYSDDEGEILKDISEIHSPVHTQLDSKTPEEIIETNNKLQVKPETLELGEESVKEECNEILSSSKEYQINKSEREYDKKRESLTGESGSDIFEGISDKRDNNIDKTISTYVSTIIEPIKKAFQPDEDIDKNNLTIVIEPEPEYEYIPLKNYSENEKVDNITILNDNIATSMTNSDKGVEGKNDSEVTAEKGDKIGLNEIMNESENIEDETKKNEKNLTRTTDKDFITTEQTYNENDEEQFGEIEEYINSLVEPIKQTFSPYEKEKIQITEVIPKKEEIVYTYIPLRDYSIESSTEDSDKKEITRKLKDEDRDIEKEEAKQDIDCTVVTNNFTKDVIEKENEGDLFECKTGIDNKTENTIQEITADNTNFLGNTSETSVIFENKELDSTSGENVAKHIINKSDDDLKQGQIDLDDGVEGITDDLDITNENVQLKNLNEKRKEIDESCLNVIERENENIVQVLHKNELNNDVKLKSDLKEIPQSMFGNGNRDNDKIADFTQKLDKTVCITSPELSVNIEQDSNSNTVLLDKLSVTVDTTGKLKEEDLSDVTINVNKLDEIHENEKLMSSIKNFDIKPVNNVLSLPEYASEDALRNIDIIESKSEENKVKVVKANEDSNDINSFLPHVLNREDNGNLKSNVLLENSVQSPLQMQQKENQTLTVNYLIPHIANDLSTIGEEKNCDRISMNIATLQNFSVKNGSRQKSDSDENKQEYTENETASKDEMSETDDLNMSITQESVDVKEEVKENLEINSVQSSSNGNENGVTEKDNLRIGNMQNFLEVNKGESEDSKDILQDSTPQEDDLNLFKKEGLPEIDQNENQNLEIEILQTDDLKNDNMQDLLEVSKEKQSDLESDAVRYTNEDVMKTRTEENLNDKSQIEHENLTSDSSITETLQKDDLKTDTAQSLSEIDQKTEDDWKTDMSISMSSSNSSQTMDNIIKVEIKDKFQDTNIIQELPENVESLKVLDGDLNEENNNKLNITEKSKLIEDEIPNKTENDSNKETENNLLTSLVSNDTTAIEQIGSSELPEAIVTSDKDLRDDKSHTSQNILKVIDTSSSTSGTESDKTDEETINEIKTQKLSQNYLQNQDFEHTNEVETIADKKRDQFPGGNLENNIYLENRKVESTTGKRNDALNFENSIKSVTSEESVGGKNLETKDMNIREGKSISSVEGDMEFSNKVNNVFNNKIENIEVPPAIDDNKHEGGNKKSGIVNSDGDDELQARIKNIEFQIEDVLERIGTTTPKEALDNQNLNLQEHNEEKNEMEGPVIQNNMYGMEYLQQGSKLIENEDTKASETNQLISNEDTQQENILEGEKVTETIENEIETTRRSKMILNNNAEVVLAPNSDANAITEIGIPNNTNTIGSDISSGKLEKPSPVSEINGDLNNIDIDQLKSDTTETIILNDKERRDAISDAENQDTIQKNEITTNTLSENIFSNNNLETNNVTNKLDIESNLNNKSLSGDDSSPEMCLEERVEIDDTVNTCEKIASDTIVKIIKQESVDEGDDQISKQNQDDSLIQQDKRSSTSEPFEKEMSTDINSKEVHNLQNLNEDTENTEDFTHKHKLDEDKFPSKGLEKEAEEKDVQNSAKLTEKENMVNLKDKNEILGYQYKDGMEETNKINEETINEQGETKLKNKENEYSQNQEDKLTDEEVKLNVTLSDEQESNNGKASPFYLHQDTLYQNKSPITQEKKYSEALRLSMDSDPKNDTTETEERLLHSSEYHDSLPINISTNTTEKPSTIQSNEVQCNMEQERRMPTSTVLVHSGELHDNVLPVALQLNQDPGQVFVIIQVLRS